MSEVAECRVCILGPSGRMGQALLSGVGSTGLTLVAAVDDPNSPLIGTEVADGVRVTSNLQNALAGADVYVDFTTPAATAETARIATELQVAAVIGTTGLDAEAQGAIECLSRVAPTIVAPNFSLGVNVLLSLAEQAARALGPGFDLEVMEIHHNQKRDAPSGTALAVAEALALGRGLDAKRSARHARAGDVGVRPTDEIGVIALRGGDVAGEHTAYLFGTDERLEITHRAGNRRIFAAGALRAAAWIVGKAPGHYTMKQVLGLAGPSPALVRP